MVLYPRSFCFNWTAQKYLNKEQNLSNYNRIQRTLCQIEGERDLHFQKKKARKMMQLQGHCHLARRSCVLHSRTGGLRAAMAAFSPSTQLKVREWHPEVTDSTDTFISFLLLFVVVFSWFYFVCCFVGFFLLQHVKGFFFNSLKEYFTCTSCMK